MVNKASKVREWSGRRTGYLQQGPSNFLRPVSLSLNLICSSWNLCTSARKTVWPFGGWHCTLLCFLVVFGTMWGGCAEDPAGKGPDSDPSVNDNPSDTFSACASFRGEIKLGVPVEAAFDESSHHLYDLTVTETAKIDISLDGIEGTSLDTVLRVYGPRDAEGKLPETKIAYDDDGGSGSFSLITNLELTPGTYGVLASTHGGASCPNEAYRLEANCDMDMDGLYDGREFDLALQFEPYLWFSPTEEFSSPEEGFRSDRLSHFAVEPVSDGGVSIFYALSYFRDYGDPTLGGLSNHLGDSEFLVVNLDAQWQLSQVFFSSHHRMWNDSSKWCTPSEMEFEVDDEGHSHPVVYVAEWKHANYRSLDECEAGSLFNDHCEEGTLERVGIERDRNVGNPVEHIIDDVHFNGNHEFYWTHLHFCGWQEPSIESSDRSGCPCAYSEIIDLWLNNQL